MPVDPTRTLPHNEDAERNLIGVLLVKPELISEVSAILEPNSFYSSCHALIFKNIVDMVTENVGVDLITLTDRLVHKRLIEQTGGIPYLTAIVENVVTVSNYGEYINIVKSNWERRKIIEIAMHMETSAFNSEIRTEDILDKSSMRIYDLSSRSTENKSQIISPEELGEKATCYLDSVITNQGLVRGIATQYDSLDVIIGGFQRKGYYVLAARPSMGKTSFALNMAMNISAIQPVKIPSIYFSMEMSSEQLICKNLSYITGIEASHIQSGLLDTNQKRQLVDNCSTLLESKLYINDASMPSVRHIRETIRRVKMREPDLGVVFIDHIGLVDLPGGADDNKSISEFSRRIKPMAKEFDVAMVVISQLNRQLEMREDKHPVLSDLRASGSLEQDADTVMFLYRDSYYTRSLPGIHPPNAEDVAELIIAKNRMGMTGSIELGWNSRTNTFVNI